MKKIIAFICAMVLAVTGISFAPSEVSAEGYEFNPNDYYVSYPSVVDYRAEDIRPSLYVYRLNGSSGWSELHEGKNYYVEFFNNFNPGTATIKITLFDENKYFVGEIIKRFTIRKLSINNFYIDLDQESFNYTGKQIRPEVYLDDPGGEIEVFDRDYQVTYRNNKKCGWGKVIVYGKYGLTGVEVGYFRIKPVVKNKNIKVRAGETKKIKVKASGKCKFKSKNKRIAKVNKKGVVTGIKKGKTKIKVTCNGQTTYAKVTVKKAKVVKYRQSNSARGTTYTAPVARKTSTTSTRTKKSKVIPKN